MAELIWGDVAVSDLEGLYDYIARDSHQYARHQVERIHQSIERLRQFPESGRKVPEFPHLPHREVIIDNYRVIYRYAADSDRVFIAQNFGDVMSGVSFLFIDSQKAPRRCC